MTRSDLFVVRIWHLIAGGFRASVRRVDEEETRHFTAPEDVARFLASAGRSDPNPDEPPTREPARADEPGRFDSPPHP